MAEANDTSIRSVYVHGLVRGVATTIATTVTVVAVTRATMIHMAERFDGRCMIIIAHLVNAWTETLRVII
jgi:hypothetical protein